MSHDFPDGPDYNPEPLDADPWNVNTATSFSASCPTCGHEHDFDTEQAMEEAYARWTRKAVQDATSDDLSPSDAPTQE